MASISVAQPTHSPAPTPMSRRLPLNNVPHAINSPLKTRSAASNPSGKRQRPDATVENDAPAMEPPTKKQAITSNAPQTPVNQKIIVREKRGSVQRKVTKQKVAAGNRDAGVVRQENAHERDNREEVLLWQRHYKKAFPTYVIFFENIPDEQGVQLYKQVKSLGSKVERFFSSSVTHVITNRTIPPDFGKLGQGKTANTLTARKSGNKVYQDRDDAESKKTDVLFKAREYGMKIWTLEKLQRMMDAMFDQSYAQPQPHTRSHTQQHHAQNPAPAANDLSIALRNERINGPVDRDPTAFAPKEMVYFKGPFLLVRDLSEKYRPILVREYPKVANKEDGIWPQFRSVGGGKCPFIEDTSIRRPQYVEERKAPEESVKPRQTIKKEIKGEMPPPQAPRTRSKRTFAEVEGSRLNKPGSTTVQAKGLQPPIELRRPAATANEIAFTAKEAVNPQRFNKEPAASGMQPSNITSAIRSNAVSSHANAEGGPKAPQSRDMHGLQRKAAVASTLEKAANKIVNSKASNSLSALAQATRSATRRITEMEKSSLPAKKEKAPAAVEVKYDPKPGYCENCKEKFDDFEEHSTSRRHRKFAATASNWAELDQLLSLLPRTPICYRPDELD